MKTIKYFEDNKRLVFLKEFNGSYFLNVSFSESGKNYTRRYKRLNYALNMFSTYVGFPEQVIIERRYFD